ncbi:hypothetical protein VTO42DRAFT_3676 [Malbranchea cinnamomea]
MQARIMVSPLPEDVRALKLLTAQYFQLVEPKFLSIPPNHVLVKPDIQESLYQDLFNEKTVWPLPPVNYRARVLKLLLTKIEESVQDPEEDEISDNLMTCYSDLMSCPRPSPLEEAQALYHVRYTPPGLSRGKDRQSIMTLENRGLILSSGTTGFRTWEAALHLGTFLSTPEGRALVHGKNVIELGAGTGLLSMYCAKYLGAESVAATDREPALITNIQNCLAKNNIQSGKVEALIWDWGTPLISNSDSSSSEHFKRTHYDIALGADLIYDADLVPLLVSTVRDLFDNYGVTVFLISATIRNETTFATFLKACETNSLDICLLNFQTSPRETQDGFFYSTDVPIRIYEISRSSGV